MLNLEQLKKIYSDIFNFQKKWNFRTDISDSEWPQIIQESQQIFDKHKCNNLVKNLIVAVMTELNKNNGKAYEDK